jgi:hypothetical protein
MDLASALSRGDHEGVTAAGSRAPATAHVYDAGTLVSIDSEHIMTLREAVDVDDATPTAKFQEIYLRDDSTGVYLEFFEGVTENIYLKNFMVNQLGSHYTKHCLLFHSSRKIVIDNVHPSASDGNQGPNMYACRDITLRNMDSHFNNWYNTWLENCTKIRIENYVSDPAQASTTDAFRFDYCDDVQMKNCYGLTLSTTGDNYEWLLENIIQGITGENTNSELDLDGIHYFTIRNSSMEDHLILTGCSYGEITNCRSFDNKYFATIGGSHHLTFMGNSWEPTEGVSNDVRRKPLFGAGGDPEQYITEIGNTWNIDFPNKEFYRTDGQELVQTIKDSNYLELESGSVHAVRGYAVGRFPGTGDQNYKIGHEHLAFLVNSDGTPTVVGTQLKTGWDDPSAAGFTTTVRAVSGAGYHATIYCDGFSNWTSFNGILFNQEHSLQSRLCRRSREVRVRDHRRYAGRHRKVRSSGRRKPGHEKNHSARQGCQHFSIHDKRYDHSPQGRVYRRKSAKILQHRSCVVRRLYGF